MPGDEHEEQSRAEPLRYRARDWLLLEGNRAVVTAATGAVLFGFLGVVVRALDDPFVDVQPLYYVFSSLIGGNVTIVTVVVAINQLLLSRELLTPDELRSQIDGVVDYRRDVEELSDRLAPVEPMGFLRLVVENTRQSAQSLAGLTRSENPAVYDEVDAVVSELTASADRIDGLLMESDASTFRVLSTTLTTNYARQINELRRLQVEYGDQFDEDVSARLDDLVHSLRDIDVARQYFKTVYMQEELSALSQYLLYVGIASTAVAAAGLVVLTSPEWVRSGSVALSVLVPVVVTVALLPLALLFAYILRVTTVTKRTAAILPFTTPTQEQ